MYKKSGIYLDGGCARENEGRKNCKWKCVLSVEKREVTKRGKEM